MNVLSTAILSLFAIKCVLASEGSDTHSKVETGALRMVVSGGPFASDAGVQQFVNEVHSGKIDEALKTYQRLKLEQLEYCAKYLIEFGNYDFMVKLIHDSDYGFQDPRFIWFLAYADGSLVDRYFGENRTSDKTLSAVAKDFGVPRTIDNFMRLLKKIESKKSREMAVRKVVYALLRKNDIKHLGAFISALEGEIVNDASLKDLAIRTVFEEGAHRINDEMITDLSEHRVITPDVYALMLFNSWSCDQKYSLFQLRLSEADQGDLQAALDKYGHKKDEARLCIAITRHMPKAKPKGSRHKRPSKRAEIAGETLDEVTRMFIEELEPEKIISEYLAGSEESRRNRMGAKIARRTMREITGMSVMAHGPADIMAEYLLESE